MCRDSRLCGRRAGFPLGAAAVWRQGWGLRLVMFWKFVTHYQWLRSFPMLALLIVTVVLRGRAAAQDVAAAEGQPWPGYALARAWSPELRRMEARLGEIREVLTGLPVLTDQDAQGTHGFHSNFSPESEEHWFEIRWATICYSLHKKSRSGRRKLFRFTPCEHLGFGLSLLRQWVLWILGGGNVKSGPRRVWRRLTLEGRGPIMAHFFDV